MMSFKAYFNYKRSSLHKVSLDINIELLRMIIHSHNQNWSYDYDHHEILILKLIYFLIAKMVLMNLTVSIT